ncbi:MAG: HlyD family secretion protein [Bacteroidota bacterium]
MIKIDDREFGLTLRAQKSSLLNQITLMLPDMKTDYPTSFPAWEAYVAQFDPNKALAPLPKPQSEQERYYLSAKNIFNLFYSIEAQDVRQEKYLIKAPFSGKVSQSSITAGTLVRTGQKLGEFFNPYRYDLEAAVTLKDLNFVKVGSQVEMRSEDISGNWTGKVVRISDAIDPNTQTVKVFVRVGGQGLKEGMYLEGAIKGQALADVVELPRAIILGDSAVYAIQADTLHLMPIKPVKFSASTVLARGIPDDTELVGEALIGAFEGMKVEAYQ